ncbi:taurine ABC transporter substrate-binding protein [Amphritea sp. 1_MG-2023]|uniref:taurine ABC transporter substrate-binding protein n=1 Tax=Amphritea sp. 1_MG-2023 TaxID=3062670 RepID=UPI0026E25829|nr:taurine ABC transporter substrate-binding protein [Amphritea sp. 1_MG-2023]MDO6563602.1 taurine ABC transporter substrate-binding protein [Amphritea sp. 1_MG-2023]
MKARKITQFVKRAATLSVLASGFVFSSMVSAETVTIGYQGIMNPWKAVIAEKQLEKATGVDIEWRRFDSGAKVITAMASGDVDIATAGSSPIAAAVNRGLEIELVWVLENINDAEALVVRDGSGIAAPQDLRGKKIGVPFVSTTHFHMLFAMEQFGLTEKDVKLINMQPNAINAAWERGDIDAAFIWDPALGRIKQSGHVLFSSGDLSRWGKATFDGLVINKSLGEEQPEFVAQMIKLIAAADDAYKAEKDGLTTESPLVQSIAKMTGGAAADVPGVLALYDFPSLTAQTGCAWLGCGAEGGASKALQFTSEFLKQQGKVRTLADDYSVFVNPSFAEAAAKL